MRQQLGIWSDAAGGFIESGFYRESDAQEAVGTFTAQGEDRQDLRILEICPDHEDQPYDDCEECLLEEDRYGEDDD